MNNDELSLWLRETWQSESEVVEGDDPEVDRLVNSDLVSVRFAVLTQLLGKLVLIFGQGWVQELGERGTDFRQQDSRLAVKAQYTFRL